MTPTITPPEQIAAEQAPENLQRWAHGPTVYAAIDALRPDWRSLDQTKPDLARRVRAWRTARHADFWAMDKVCVALDIMVFDLEIWAAEQGRPLWRRHSRAAYNVPEHQRVEIAARYRAGESSYKLARIFNVHRTIIPEWAKQYA